MSMTEKERGYQEKYRAANAEKVRERNRLYKERMKLETPGFREKCREIHKRYRDLDPEEYKAYRKSLYQKHRARILKRMQCKAYGITEEQYDGMVAEQGDLCAICGKAETATRNGKTLRLAIDHDAETGKVRGLLCGRCNMMIGQSKHEPDILRKGAEYLERNAR